MTASSNVIQLAQAWLADDVDDTTRTELAALIESGDQAELQERFAGRLQFGTAGIRGVLGAGPMRMNRVVVRQVSAGLGAYLLENLPDAKQRGVVVGHDARTNSRIFAEDTARVLAGLGLPVFLFARDVPTPVVAFAVLSHRAAAGIMVTASHNPPEYNGYKVYWENGAQIISPIDKGIASEIDKVGATSSLAMPSLEAARASGLVTELGADDEGAYLAGVNALCVHPEAPTAAPIKIAYTALHGVGDRFVQAALASAGHASVWSEPSQQQPDGSFPTVRFPNPEEPGAMDRVLALATANGVDLVLANDPDADRLAVAIPEGDGYRMLTGDQVGVLLADYLLREGPKDNRMVATSIVSSQLLSVLAGQQGAAFQETLTGFKWIANAAIAHSAAHGSRFVMGYEEALGYCIGELVRDKDGVSAALLFAELAAFAKQQGQTIDERLADLYRRVGVFVTEQVSLTLPGAEGLAEIARLMKTIRAAPPSEIGGIEVTKVDDLIHGSSAFPPSDVLIFRLAGDQRVIMRPSGTEPKLKSYYEVRAPLADGESLESATQRGKAALIRLRDAHQGILGAAR